MFTVISRYPRPETFVIGRACNEDMLSNFIGDKGYIEDVFLNRPYAPDSRVDLDHLQELYGIKSEFYVKLSTW